MTETDLKSNVTQSTQPPKSAAERFVGLKWIFAILFLGILMLALLNYCLYNITSENNMKQTLAKTLAIVFRQDGMKEATPIINYLNVVAKHKTELNSLQSLTTIDQTTLQNDLKNMSPEQSQKYLEDKFAGPIYESSKIVDSLKQVDPNATVEPSQIDFINLANANSHALLKRTLTWQGIILIILLILIMVLSVGAKRLSTPGILILLGALPGLLLFGFFNNIAEKFIAPYLSKNVNAAIYDSLSKEVIAPLILMMRNVYVLSAIIGVVLIVLAIIIGAAMNHSFKVVSQPNK